jgi:hypothetical protein
MIEATAALMKSGGRLFYLGAGTSGRLGILDAAEWYGVLVGCITCEGTFPLHMLLAACCVVCCSEEFTITVHHLTPVLLLL